MGDMRSCSSRVLTTGAQKAGSALNSISGSLNKTAMAEAPVMAVFLVLHGLFGKRSICLHPFGVIPGEASSPYPELFVKNRLFPILWIKGDQTWDVFSVLAQLSEGRRSGAALTGIKPRPGGKDVARDSDCPYSSWNRRLIPPLLVWADRGRLPGWDLGREL